MKKSTFRFIKAVVLFGFFVLFGAIVFLLIRQHLQNVPSQNDLATTVDVKSEEQNAKTELRNHEQIGFRYKSNDA